MPKRSDSRDMTYQGFEQGPIRPPSEAHSLLLRVTRNCPWNHCTFCPVYKGAPFSVRPLAHIVRDIDAVYEATQQLREGPRDTGRDGSGRGRRPPGLGRGQELGEVRPGASFYPGCQQPGGGPRGPDGHSPASHGAFPGSDPDNLVRPLQHHRQSRCRRPGRPAGTPDSAGFTSAWNRGPTKS